MKGIPLKDRIEKLLQYLNLTQKEFAEKTGLSENTISHTKKGKHVPNLTFFNAIYKQFPNLNPKWLYMGTGEMFLNKNEISENGKKEKSKTKTTSIKLGESECNEELEAAEMEINYLKSEIEDKKHIISLLKNVNIAR